MAGNVKKTQKIRENVVRLLRQPATTVSLIFVILYFFRQSVMYVNPKIGYQLVGNLDPFYLLGLIYLFLHFKKVTDREKLGVVLLYAFMLLQFVVDPEINLLRAFVNVTKIILCYFVMKYSAYVIAKYKVQLKVVTISFGLLCYAFLALALVFYNSNILWRLNDTINVFDLHRLQLLYTEPGELGMHCSIMLILATYILIKGRHKIPYFLTSILPLTICLSFTRSLGGIAVGCVGICAVLLSDLLADRTKRKMAVYGILFAVAIVAIAAMAFTNNTLYLRIMKVFSNSDSSTRYRITMAFRLVPHVLSGTYWLGAGFGNLELARNVQKYRQYGMNEAGIINSFMNFIAESGIVGITLIFVLGVVLIRTCIRSRRPDKYGLLVFLFIYQFMGTYFTNPLLWVLYGFILAPATHELIDIEELKKAKRNRNGKKRVLFIDQCVDLVGGVERIICTLSNELSKEYEIHVLSETKLVKKSFFKYSPRVKNYYLFDRTRQPLLHDQTQGSFFIYKIAELAKRSFIALARPSRINEFFTEHSHYDVVIFGRTTIATHFLSSIAQLDNRPRVIVRDAIHLRYMRPKERRAVLRYFPNLVNTFIVSSDESLREYKSFFGDATMNIVKIYNPLSISPKSSWSPKHKTITAIGRIDDDQKGFSVLIPAMSKINDIHPDWKLVIYGSGNDKAKIENLLGKYNNNNIELREYTDDVVKVFRDTSIFAFPSRYEGYANTLVEALACGVPSVTFNWLCGADEIVKDMKNGIIVKLQNREDYFNGGIDAADINNFADSICYLIKNEEITANMSKQAKKIASSRNRNRIIKEWKKVIEG